MKKCLLMATGLLLAIDAVASVCQVKMLPEENWWGVDNAFGRDMPFTAASEFACDLRQENYSHQALSFLVSDRGRAVWSAEPVEVKISSGTIRLESSRGEIVVDEQAGVDLPSAFRAASKRWFPPKGGTPDLLYFSAPQYNTWIELTYHQNEKDILAYAQSMLDNGLPPGIFMIDDTWQEGYGTWEFDPRRFQNPKGMMDKLHAMGFKVLLWMCPWVSMDTPAYREVIGVNGRGPGGFLCAKESVDGRKYTKWRNDPAASPWWNGKSALIDLSHPNGKRWFSAQLERLVKAYGADGFKLDGGGVLHYNRGFLAFDPSLSAVQQSALYGEYARIYPSSEYRNCFGFAGEPIIMRLHDKGHSWKELQRIVPDLLGAGMVGCPFICPDMIGGGAWTAFLPGAPFEPEIFIRSAQIHALGPMMQISASPWRVLSPEHQKMFKEIVALRQRFAPRFVELAKASARTGEPMMRYLEYNYPRQGYAAVKDQFMMGEDLLVAPVVEKGATTRKVILPSGRWRADDGRVYEGPRTVEVDAPLARLPYFEAVR